MHTANEWRTLYRPRLVWVGSVHRLRQVPVCGEPGRRFYSLNQEALSAQLRIRTQRLKRRIIVMVLWYMVLCYRQINGKEPTIKFHWNFLGNIEIH